jgi:hypothetical protein
MKGVKVRGCTAACVKSSMLTFRVFFGSAGVMRRADAGATASAEVALVGSTADSIKASEI